MRGNSYAVATAFVLVAVAGVTGTSEARADFQAGIVLDADRSRVFVMTPEQTIAAIDLDSGKKVWDSEFAALPIGLHQGLVVAQEDVEEEQVLGLVFLDAADGSVAGEALAKLSAPVRVAIRDTTSSRFRASAYTLGRELIVEWEHVQLHKTYGMKDAGKPGATASSGALQVDVRTGSVVELDQAPQRGAREIPAALRDKVARGLAPQPATAGGLLFSIDPVAGDPPGRKVLRRWDGASGADLAPVRISETGLDLRLPSADGRHFLASGPKLAPERSLESWAWVVLDLLTGKERARVVVEVPAAPFVVHGGALILELPLHGFRDGEEWIDEPRQLRAVGLSSGEKVWKQPVFDPIYRGPVPPGTERPPKRTPKAPPAAPAPPPAAKQPETYGEGVR
jgi:hypothetical protein